MLSKDSVTRTDLKLFRSPTNLGFDLSIIVPTRNEVGNVRALLEQLNKVLDGIHAEVLFVDDSTDETPQAVEAAIPEFPALTIRLLHRSAVDQTGGLGGAVLLGMQNVHSRYACVMDGDLQHPPELLPVLLQTAQDKDVDLVVATRR